MPLRLEDYALVGDTRTAALVGRDGSVDWLCVPRFDSDACFAALLGGPEHGRWLVAPTGGGLAARRHYRGDSLVLETEFETADGTVRVVDCMPVYAHQVHLLRRVEGVSGRVPMRTEVVLRFDYGITLPWIRAEGDRRLRAIAGPNTVVVDGDVSLAVAGGTMSGEFTVGAGDAVDLRLTRTERDERPADLADVNTVAERNRRWWQDWADHCRLETGHRDEVMRSLITLKALSYHPSGAIIAAPTTSLPETLGGIRNWDYRYGWIRDATYTLLVLLDAGYTEEAVAWREWLVRAVAGAPDQMHIMYGVEGERRLSEQEIDWLPGYAGSRPVRVGNAAARQFQLDVYGELMDALYHARDYGIEADPEAWRVQRELMDFLESHWRDPDEGIWEVRASPRHFTHSKVMAWVAADRAVKTVVRHGLDGPADRWRRLRKEIFDEVCDKGYNVDRQTFTRAYGSTDVDVALLQLAPVGFLPATDPRILGTVAAVERDLYRDGLVFRYPPEEAPRLDGLPPGEAALIGPSFWLVDNYLLRGDLTQGRAIFDRLLMLPNDVGLLAESYDLDRGRMVGNFPQALSHLQLVDTALHLTQEAGPVPRRAVVEDEPPADERKPGER